MKIMIIADGFAPSSIIGAVRPTKFAKYLSAFGHEVTVMCSNTCYGAKNIDSLKGLENVKVCRYGEERDADIKSTGRKKIGRETTLYRFAKKIYLAIMWPIIYYKKNIAMYYLMREYFKANLMWEEFDCIVATFPDLGNVMMMNYLGKCGYDNTILDLRDNMTDPRYPTIVNLINGLYQKRTIKKSKRTFIISESATLKLKKENRGSSKKVFTLYNGYDDPTDNPLDSIRQSSFSPDKLTFAYTGGLYSGLRDLTPLLEVINELSSDSSGDYEIHYAGNDFEILKDQARKYQLESILVNHGLVNSKGAEEIQLKADVFLVASWNTTKEQGVLTGKFYEGIRCFKPIVALVSGDVIDSELYSLNMKYGYGFCYEAKRNGDHEKLRDYVYQLYLEKKKNGQIANDISDELKEKFHYKNLSKELEKHLLEIVEGNK